MKQIIIYSLLILLLGCYSKEPEKTGFEGKPLPSFKLFLKDSITYLDTKSIPSGKPIIFFYFGPSCPYSKAQMQEIIDNMQSLKDIRFYVFTTWPFSQMNAFYSNYNLNKYRNIIVGVDYQNFFRNYYGVPGVPYTAIYGRNLLLKKAFAGKVTARQLLSVAND